LIARCKAKVAERPRRVATTEQLKNGVPLFLEQLTRTPQAEEDGEAWESLKISGASGGDTVSLSEIGVTAAATGIGRWIAKGSVEADDGVLTVRDVPGTGCVFTVGTRAIASDTCWPCCPTR
jgi:hypothetical protein